MSTRKKKKKALPLGSFEFDEHQVSLSNGKKKPKEEDKDKSAKGVLKEGCNGNPRRIRLSASNGKPYFKTARR